MQVIRGFRYHHLSQAVCVEVGCQVAMVITLRSDGVGRGLYCIRFFYPEIHGWSVRKIGCVCEEKFPQCEYLLYFGPLIYNDFYLSG